MITIVGKTNKDGSIAPHSPVVVTRAKTGDIVYVGGEWYRVYESGSKGLRYWNVTKKFADAVAEAEAEIEHVSAMAMYDDYIQSLPVESGW